MSYMNLWNKVIFCGLVHQSYTVVILNCELWLLGLYLFIVSIIRTGLGEWASSPQQVLLFSLDHKCHLLDIHCVSVYYQYFTISLFIIWISCIPLQSLCIFWICYIPLYSLYIFFISYIPLYLVDICICCILWIFYTLYLMDILYFVSYGYFIFCIIYPILW